MNSSYVSTREGTDWTIIGHKTQNLPERKLLTPRAVYPFQSRIKHIGFRRIKKNKNQSYDNALSFNSNFGDTDHFKKFPIRKGPISVRSKRLNQEFIDILGTQLIYVPIKKNNRL
jgi:hypothetical protein